MKRFVLSAVTAACLFGGAAFAEETVGEKVKATGNDAARTTKKAGHDVSEALCTGTKAECAKEKAKHKGTEVKDSATDKASEVKNKVD
ncbi:MAG: hypothetical protein ACT4TC_16130 [Myxococcaceae bacterium]